jgi:hypothetical protein
MTPKAEATTPRSQQPTKATTPHSQELTERRAIGDKKLSSAGNLHSVVSL